MKEIGFLFLNGRGGAECSGMRLARQVEEFSELKVPKYLMRHDRKYYPLDWDYLNFEVIDYSDYDEVLEKLNDCKRLVVIGTIDGYLAAQNHDKEIIPRHISLVLDYEGELILYMPGDLDNYWSRPLYNKASKFVGSRVTHMKYIIDNYYPEKKNTPYFVSGYAVDVDSIPQKAVNIASRKEFVFTPRADTMKRFHLFVEAMLIANLKEKLVVAGQAMGVSGGCYITNYVRDGIIPKEKYYRKGYTKDDIPTVLSEAKFSVDFTRKLYDGRGFQNCSIESIGQGVLPITSYGWDPCYGKGMVELDKCTSVHRITKTVRQSVVETLKKADAMTQGEYDKRYSNILDYIRENEDYRVVAPKLVNFFLS